jgi:hypothetical protein
VIIIAEIFENHKDISKYSGILLIGIMCIIENMISYIIVKTIIGLNNKIRSNGT